MIHMIVGRLHVSASNRDVIQAIRDALTPVARKGRKHREARHAMFREGIEIHRDNRNLYRAVVGGRI
jgi:hypothetical protein